MLGMFKMYQDIVVHVDLTFAPASLNATTVAADIDHGS
jgi:hypothetical protein